MIKSLDRSVGRVTQALKDNALEDNAMIIFVSITAVLINS
jgi:arylsulfatase A-like enzyme